MNRRKGNRPIRKAGGQNITTSWEMTSIEWGKQVRESWGTCIIYSLRVLETREEEACECECLHQFLSQWVMKLMKRFLIATSYAL